MPESTLEESPEEVPAETEEERVKREEEETNKELKTALKLEAVEVGALAGGTPAGEQAIFKNFEKKIETAEEAIKAEIDRLKGLGESAPEKANLPRAEIKKGCYDELDAIVSAAETTSPGAYGAIRTAVATGIDGKISVLETSGTGEIPKLEEKAKNLKEFVKIAELASLFASGLSDSTKRAEAVLLLKELNDGSVERANIILTGSLPGTDPLAKAYIDGLNSDLTVEQGMLPSEITVSEAALKSESVKLDNIITQASALATVVGGTTTNTSVASTPGGAVGTYNAPPLLIATLPATLTHQESAFNLQYETVYKDYKEQEDKVKELKDNKTDIDKILAYAATAATDPGDPIRQKHYSRISKGKVDVYKTDLAKNEAELESAKYKLETWKEIKQKKDTDNDLVHDINPMEDVISAADEAALTAVITEIEGAIASGQYKPPGAAAFYKIEAKDATTLKENLQKANVQAHKKLLEFKYQEAKELEQELDEKVTALGSFETSNATLKARIDALKQKKADGTLLPIEAKILEHLETDASRKIGDITALKSDIAKLDTALVKLRDAIKKLEKDTLAEVERLGKFDELVKVGEEKIKGREFNINEARDAVKEPISAFIQKLKAENMDLSRVADVEAAFMDEILPVIEGDRVFQNTIAGEAEAPSKIASDMFKAVYKDILDQVEKQSKRIEVEKQKKKNKPGFWKHVKNFVTALKGGFIFGAGVAGIAFLAPGAAIIAPAIMAAGFAIGGTLSGLAKKRGHKLKLWTDSCGDPDPKDIKELQDRAQKLKKTVIKRSSADGGDINGEACYTEVMDKVGEDAINLFVIEKKKHYDAEHIDKIIDEYSAAHATPAVPGGAPPVPPAGVGDLKRLLILSQRTHLNQTEREERQNSLATNEDMIKGFIRDRARDMCTTLSQSIKASPQYIAAENRIKDIYPRACAARTNEIKALDESIEVWVQAQATLEVQRRFGMLVFDNAAQEAKGLPMGTRRGAYYIDAAGNVVRPADDKYGQRLRMAGEQYGLSADIKEGAGPLYEKTGPHWLAGAVSDVSKAGLAAAGFSMVRGAVTRLGAKGLDAILHSALAVPIAGAGFGAAMGYVNAIGGYERQQRMIELRRRVEGTKTAPQMIGILKNLRVQLEKDRPVLDLPREAKPSEIMGAIQSEIEEARAVATNPETSQIDKINIDIEIAEIENIVWKKNSERLNKVIKAIDGTSAEQATALSAMKAEQNEEIDLVPPAGTASKDAGDRMFISRKKVRDRAEELAKEAEKARIELKKEESKFTPSYNLTTFAGLMAKKEGRKRIGKYTKENLGDVSANIGIGMAGGMMGAWLGGKAFGMAAGAFGHHDNDNPPGGGKDDEPGKDPKGGVPGGGRDGEPGGDGESPDKVAHALAIAIVGRDANGIEQMFAQAGVNTENAHALATAFVSGDNNAIAAALASAFGGDATAYAEALASGNSAEALAQALVRTGGIVAIAHASAGVQKDGTRGIRLEDPPSPHPDHDQALADKITDAYRYKHDTFSPNPHDNEALARAGHTFEAENVDAIMKGGAELSVKDAHGNVVSHISEGEGSAQDRLSFLNANGHTGDAVRAHVSAHNIALPNGEVLNFEGWTNGEAMEAHERVGSPHVLDDTTVYGNAKEDMVGLMIKEMRALDPNITDNQIIEILGKSGPNIDIDHIEITKGAGGAVHHPVAGVSAGEARVERLERMAGDLEEIRSKQAETSAHIEKAESGMAVAKVTPEALKEELGIADTAVAHDVLGELAKNGIDTPRELALFKNHVNELSGNVDISSEVNSFITQAEQNTVHPRGDAWVPRILHFDDTSGKGVDVLVNIRQSAEHAPVEIDINGDGKADGIDELFNLTELKSHGVGGFKTDQITEIMFKPGPDGKGLELLKPVDIIPADSIEGTKAETFLQQKYIDHLAGTQVKSEADTAGGFKPFLYKAGDKFVQVGMSEQSDRTALIDLDNDGKGDVLLHGGGGIKTLFDRAGTQIFSGKEIELDEVAEKLGGNYTTLNKNGGVGVYQKTGEPVQLFFKGDEELALPAGTKVGAGTLDETYSKFLVIEKPGGENVIIVADKDGSLGVPEIYTVPQDKANDVIGVLNKGGNLPEGVINATGVEALKNALGVTEDATSANSSTSAELTEQIIDRLEKEAFVNREYNSEAALEVARGDKMYNLVKGSGKAFFDFNKEPNDNIGETFIKLLGLEALIHKGESPEGAPSAKAVEAVIKNYWDRCYLADKTTVNTEFMEPIWTGLDKVKNAM